jgi:hypothetical protein
LELINEGSFAAFQRKWLMLIGRKGGSKHQTHIVEDEMSESKKASAVR